MAKPWTERHLARFNPDWVDLATSFQWKYFRQTIETLREHGNRVFVLVGPFNEHMLTAEGLRGYERIRSAAEVWFAANGIPYCAPRSLPTECYADASHPLAAGYALMAEGLLTSDTFRRFSSVR